MGDLTDRQRAALWYRAQGLTAKAIGKRLDPPASASGAQDLLHKAIINLGARDSTHAVFLALVRGVIGPYIDCGSRKAYLRHLRRKEQTCIACRKANVDAVHKQREVLPPRCHDSGNNRGRARVTGLSPRMIDVLSAVRAGAWSSPTVARELGISQAQAWRHIDQIMKRLGVDRTSCTPREALEQAVERGVARGYLSA